MVVVGGGWVVLSLHSPLLYGCCGRGLGCIKSSVTSAVWLLWEVVGLYIVFTHLCCMVVVGGGSVIYSLHSPLLYGCCEQVSLAFVQFFHLFLLSLELLPSAHSSAETTQIHTS